MDINWLGRIGNILDYALIGLQKKRMKSLAIVVIFALVVFFFSSFQLIGSALRESAVKLLAGAPDITVQQLSAGRQTSIEKSKVDSITAIYGIKKVRERIWGYYFDEKNGANFTVIGLSLDSEMNTLYSDDLVEGRLPSSGSRYEVVLGKDVHGTMGLANRKRFSLFRPDLSMVGFTMVGQFHQDSDLILADVMLMSLDDAQDLFSLPAWAVTDFVIDVYNANEIETIAEKISSKLSGVRVITRDRILKTYKGVFSWRSGLGMICLLGALASFGILAWDKATGLTDEEKQEVGVLKVIGWQTEDLILLRVFEGLVVSVIAFCCGYVLGWIHVAYFNGYLFRPVMLGWSVVRPSFSFSPPFVFADLLVIFAVSVVPYLCATVVPAWKSAVVRPESVI